MDVYRSPARPLLFDTWNTKGGPKKQVTNIELPVKIENFYSKSSIELLVNLEIFYSSIQH